MVHLPRYDYLEVIDEMIFKEFLEERNHNMNQKNPSFKSFAYLDIDNYLMILKHQLL